MADDGITAYEALGGDAALRAIVDRFYDLMEGEAEYAELLEQIAYYEEILGSETRLMGVVADELVAVRAKYADDRRTRIVDAAPYDAEASAVNHVRETGWTPARNDGHGQTDAY